MTEPIEWRPLPQALLTRDPRVLDLSWPDRGLLSALFVVVDDEGTTGDPRPVSDLASRIGWRGARKGLTTALRRLETAGLIAWRGEGQERVITIVDYRAHLDDEGGPA